MMAEVGSGTRVPTVVKARARARVLITAGVGRGARVPTLAKVVVGARVVEITRSESKSSDETKNLGQSKRTDSNKTASSSSHSSHSNQDQIVDYGTHVTSSFPF